MLTKFRNGKRTKSVHHQIAMASMEAIRAIVAERQATALVWNDEGEFVDDVFVFNEKHDGFEPLIVDLTTASIMCQVADAISDENKAKLAEWVGKGRGHFAKVYEISMKAVK